MKVVSLYKDLKLKYLEYVILIKVGTFYEVYGEEAYILSNLFNYKVKEAGTNIRVGFPITAYNKVTDRLNSFKINYVVYDKEIILKKRFKLNNYSNYLCNDLSIDERIGIITQKLNILKENSKIDSILKKVENII